MTTPPGCLEALAVGQASCLSSSVSVDQQFRRSRKGQARRLSYVLSALLFACGVSAQGRNAADPWPAITRECKPWAYWWWMGSAVDETNLTRELQRYQAAGMGGVHVIPIYGAKGYEDHFIDYLSPKWMNMLHYTVCEAERLGLGVDMTTGTGWCFGGPRVKDEHANAAVVCEVINTTPGAKVSEKIERTNLQALMAFSFDGRCIDLLSRLSEEGALDWVPDSGDWKLYAVSQKPSGQKVKRASSGGQGHMLNLVCPEAIREYLRWFDEAFQRDPGPNPRAMYHDSYEYRSDWAPDFFAAFEKRRGYSLKQELPALFSGMRSGSGTVPVEKDQERVARIKSDYRETISDVMAEESLPMWAEWSRKHGFKTRNEAHGSPGNWLDLYASADIPETEMFHTDRNKLISKFASSAAHVAGRDLVASETGTWLAEHFTETLADMKYLLDDLFLSGVNHVFYHGTCYSPDEAGWPGWLFYASYEMNPRNSVWRDVPALNQYAARCQSVLQYGRPDNDILVYWPIYDVWHSATGMARNFTVHARDWFEPQPIGKTAEHLWNRGYAFDYASDRQLSSARAGAEGIHMPGGIYRIVVVPPTEHMPLGTLSYLLELAKSGATVAFEDYLPKDVPGWGRLTARRAQFQELLKPVEWREQPGGKLRTATLGKGRVLVGEIEAALASAGVAREPMFDRPGLACIRRAFDGGRFYFVANRSQQKLIGWVPLARVGTVESVLAMNPVTGSFGQVQLRRPGGGMAEVFLAIDPGESLILRCAETGRQPVAPASPQWPNWIASGPVAELRGVWELVFQQGGPTLPQPVRMERPASWTTLTNADAQRFAGVGVYRLTFDSPGGAGPWLLDLGKVCQSARVILNGRNLGAFITPPFRVLVDSLRPSGNVLEVEVANVSANRIRDLDRRQVRWRNFYDINFVNIDYKPFDASNWPLTDSGLVGPVTLARAQMAAAPGQ